MTTNFQALGDKAAAQGADFTKTTKGGGDGPKSPALGVARLRLVGYVELGIQKQTFQGVEQEKPKFKLIFELSGKNHAPREFEGKKQPWLMEVEETLSRNEKANASKLFASMNHQKKFAHFAQMLGEAFLGTVTHRKYARHGEDRSKPETWTGVAADLRERGQPYTIRAPQTYDAENEVMVNVKVDAPLTPLKCFLWDHADQQQWDSLFIEGEYAEVKDDAGKVVKPARSRNVLQEKIKGAVNFKGSPIEALLGGVAPATLQSVAAPDLDDDIPF